MSATPLPRSQGRSTLNLRLSLEEVESSARCQRALVEWGFEVEPGTAGLPTAFVATAVLGSGNGPCVGLVAEFDALPNVGHGCGHHLIAGGILEAAGRLVLDTDVDGVLKVLGTPGEEQAAGKRPMLEAGAFQGVDAVVTYHPLFGAGVFGHLNGTAVYELLFHGKSSHAASTPWDGRSAQDGVTLAVDALSMERQYLHDGCRIHSVITEVRGAHNVLPDIARVLVNIRAPTKEQLDDLKQRVDAIARGVAGATATKVDIEIIQSAEPYLGNQGLAELAWDVMNLPPGTSFDIAGSTDLGDVSRAIPTVTVTEKGWEPVSWHSAELHAASGTDDAYASMHRAADYVTQIAHRILTGERPWE